MSGYAVLKPNTPYQSEEDCPMKFDGEGDDLDDAVRRIQESGVPFKMANTDLLEYAVTRTPPKPLPEAPRTP